jgi:hypothetical protein
VQVAEVRKRPVYSSDAASLPPVATSTCDLEDDASMYVRPNKSVVYTCPNTTKGQEEAKYVEHMRLIVARAVGSTWF